MSEIKIDTRVFSEKKQSEKSVVKVRVKDFSAHYGAKTVLHNITTEFIENEITAIIGPSGCGKSTFIRSINRLHELTRGAGVTGKIYIDGHDIYHPDANPVLVRRKIGMVFQKPNPFPNMSIYDNVIAGLKLQGVSDREKLDEIVETTLSKVGLYDEVSDDLHRKKGTDLSGGQQQRLCIARAIAVKPEVVLMDEPTASLDPSSTLIIEDLMKDLSKEYTVIAVTHNMQQGARVSHKTMFFYNGKLIEAGPTRKIFEKPENPLTEQYITGRFG